MCSGTLVAAHSLATFPVLGGISGSTSATLITGLIIGCCVRLPLVRSLNDGVLQTKQKKRRTSLEVFVVPFATGYWPRMFVCAC